jgi:hypothetical protein
MNKVLTAEEILRKHIQEFKHPVELPAIYDEDYAGGKYLCINESVVLAAMEAYKNQSPVSEESNVSSQEPDATASKEIGEPLVQNKSNQ